jgi:hypothetical protein
MTKSGSILMRIGILFTVLGFGSLILRQFNIDFRLIAWADDMQPTFGIVLGLVGVVIIALPFVLARRKPAQQPQQQFAPQPQQFAPPQPHYPPQQQYPTQPYSTQPPAPGVPPQQFPHQQPGRPG